MVTVDWREGLAGISRFARLMVFPSCVAMLYAKFASIWALNLTRAGSVQIKKELDMTSVAAWVAPDLLTGILWGAFVAVLVGWSYRRMTVIRIVAVSFFGLLLSIFLMVSIEVVRLFAMQPQMVLLAALSDPTDASDSLANLFNVRVTLNALVLLAITIAGPLFLERYRSRLESLAAKLGIALAAVLVVVVTTGLFASRSTLELDHNPVVRLASSLFGEGSVAYAIPMPAGNFTRVLTSVTEQPEHDVDLSAYRALKRWAGNKQPNVVLVIWESTAPAHMGAFGGPVANTPVTSSFVAHGISWPNHFSHTPTSMFAIYSIVASNHGTPFGKYISQTRPRIAADSLSEVLTRAGYRAGLFHSGHFSFFEKDLFFAGRGYEVMDDALSLPNRGHYVDGSWGIEEKAAVDAIVNWAKDSGDGDAPLFVTYIPFSPHHPYDVPLKYRRKFKGHGNIGRYRNAIFYMDAMIGELERGLENVGLSRDTLYVLVGDHGEGFGEHPGSFMHGLNLYQEGVRSFAVFYAPKLPLEGFADPRNFGHVDITPTLLDLLGIHDSPAHVGMSALKAGRRPMIPLYSGKTARQNVGFVDGTLKYTIDLRTKRSLLFDLKADPGEKKDLSRLHPDLIGAFYKRALQFISEQKAWEASLPDVDDSALRIDGSNAKTITVAVSECPLGSHFEIQGGRVTMVRPGTRSFDCTVAMPVAGTVTGFRLVGREDIAGALIAATMQSRSASGERRVLAHCILNGNAKKLATTCDAVLAVGRGSFGPGTLDIELRYTASGGNLNGIISASRTSKSNTYKRPFLLETSPNHSSCPLVDDRARNAHGMMSERKHTESVKVCAKARHLVIPLISLRVFRESRASGSRIRVRFYQSGVHVAHCFGGRQGDSVAWFDGGGQYSSCHRLCPGWGAVALPARGCGVLTHNN